MSGRPKQEVFQYDADGKYIRKYNSQSEVREKYFSDDLGKRPLFNVVTPYQEMPDGTYIAPYRIGRDKLREAIRLYNCPYCKKHVAHRPVYVYNLIGEKIAEFSNIRVASLMTGIDYATITHRVKNGKHHTDNLLFTYEQT